MNDALIAWLATPYAPDEPLTFEEFLARRPWHAQAARRGSGASDYVHASPRTPYSEAQRAVCASCPVQPECLSFALADESVTGLWGGLDDAERRELRRRRRVA